MPVNQPLHGLADDFRVHVTGIFDMQFQRATKNAAHGVDLFNCQRQTVLELDPVGGRGPRHRQGGADRNWRGVLSMRGVDPGEQGRTGPEGRGS